MNLDMSSSSDIIIATDPSLKACGICVFDGRDFHFDKVGVPTNPDKSYPQLFKDVNLQTKNILSSIYKLIGDPAEVDLIHYISECPPPFGQMSSALYGLDIHLHNSLKELEFIDDAYCLYPNWLGSVIHGKRSYNKSESVKKFKEYLSIMGYKDPGRIDSNICEAGLFCLRAMAKYNMGNIGALKDVNPKLFEEREKFLF